MRNQMISAILLRGLLMRGGISQPAWKSGVYVQSNRFGGEYKQKPGARPITPRHLVIELPFLQEAA